MERQLLVDIWEGNVDLQPTVLLNNGVKGMIVRINDISGGLHIDSNFYGNLEIAKTFPVYGIYAVYNPWVSGQTNYNWLMSKLPTDFVGRIFVDIEVVYNGYSPVTYANEVASFLASLSNKHLVSPYTGQWFLSYLAYWPTNLDYWWAAYPTALNNCQTWENYNKILDTIPYAFNKSYCPSRVMLWQSSGDGVKSLPGFGGHAVDVNVFLGSLDELKIWFGQPSEPLPPEPTDTIKQQLLDAIANIIILINELP
jgi:GH25 family lysozyme M1 (1,4-beta-N-acetylmuramidase)